MVRYMSIFQNCTRRSITIAAEMRFTGTKWPFQAHVMATHLGRDVIKVELMIRNNHVAAVGFVVCLLERADLGIYVRVLFAEVRNVFCEVFA